MLYFVYMKGNGLKNALFHLQKSRDYFNICHPNMSFLFEKGRKGKLSYLDIEISREKGKFFATVYDKPTLSGVYNHFESFYFL